MSNSVAISDRPSSSSFNRDVTILFLQRIIRMAAFACSTLVLTVFLTAAGISKSRIGFFMTLTLAGEVLVGLLTSFTADYIGRRTVLCIGSLLMAVSGAIFALSNNFWILLAASIAGVITPSGYDIGPFKAIEESTLSQLIPAKNYNAVIACYYLLGSCGRSIGTMACGWMIKTLQDHHWSALETYHLVFWVYAAAGILKFMLSAMLSKDSEKNPHKKGIIAGDETEPLLAPNKDKNSSPSARLHISKATRRFLLNISLFFALDSLGVGMASNTWIIYFVKSKFQLDDRILGFIFSSSDLLEGLSNVMAIPSVRRIGLVKSIVLGGILSSPALILLPFPRHIAGTVALLLARAMFVEFHQPARQTFISQSVLPDERTAVIGVLTVVRTVAQSPGPAITGQLAQHNLLWLSFTIAGGIKLFYSVLFSISFSNTDIRESAQG